VSGEEVAQRRRDLSAGEDPCSDLVEQRLEEMVVDAVDQRDLDIAAHAHEPPGHLVTAEATADHHDARARGRR
jgi:hypothetical protein